MKPDMIDATFILGTIALLAAPGPTNALLFTAGATRGLEPSLPLAASAVVGYLTASATMLYLAGPALSVWPWLYDVLKAAVCIYLLMLAWTMWCHGMLEGGNAALITPGRVVTTTLLNPKCAVVAFALIPQSAADDLTQAAPVFFALACMVSMVALSWAAMGVCASRTAPALQRPAVYCRIGALTMVLFSGLLARSLLGSA